MAHSVRTEVYDMDTGKFLVYDLPARRAVAAAWRQYTKGDYNTWNVPDDDSDAPIEEGRWHWFCGSYSARKDDLENARNNDCTTNLETC